MVTTTKGQRLSVPLSSELAEELISFGQREQAEVHVILLAAWVSLHHRYTGQEKVTAGVKMEGSQETVIPLTVDFSVMSSFGDQVRAVHKLLQEYRESAPIGPYSEAQEAEPAVLHTGFVMREETASAPADSDLPALGQPWPKGLLTLEMLRSPASWTASLLYEDQEDEAAMVRRLEHFRQLLFGCIRQGQLPIDRIPLLTEHESEMMLVDWNRASTKPPENPSIPHWFEAQVKRTPDAAAVICGEERLTYAELDQRAKETAQYLLQKGITSEALVGVHLERTIDMVVAILGILKAGGAYVPLDPAYATERLSYILEDAGAPVLLTQESLAASFGGRAVELVYMDRDREAMMEAGRQPLRTPPPIRGDHLAYVVYTSGSTGKPKGVAVEHSSVIALVQWAQEVYTAEEMAGVLGSTSINFDLSVFEMFVTWSMGGSLILAENALQLPLLPAAGEVTLINTVPSAIRELVRMQGIPASVRTVNLCGEPLKRALVEQIYEVDTVEKVINLYGPSEDTVYSTYIHVSRGPELPVWIGRPIHNTQAYVLDKHLQPVPVGVSGELYLGGEGLARGYLYREELTREKFIPNPFSPRPGERMYRTGDLVRYTADGNLEYLGRIDHQIKLRGFRIELGDIESVLIRHPDIQDAVVVARECNPADLRLAAYFTTKLENRRDPAEQSAWIREIRGYLQQRLPGYMIPSYFVPLEHIPLTANGKTDRQALPQPQVLQGTRTPPRNEIEEKLAAIWRDVLQLEAVGVEDHFLDLGGQSILATQILVRMRAQFRIDLTVRQVFEAATITEQAQVIAEARKQGERQTTAPAIVPRARAARKLQGEGAVQS
ncbi:MULTISPECIES: non-ribosomal peptide synthetase [Paenibacillus]|uniref:non-ribosomal peptide synthetase n=1 Tax=Paenibacillus TaxID=44249 RepID=UPI0022B8E2A4|nr:amino acid adenylation domain-containing protein [Paenibacillus caseinilyticus]MCZ8521839.1 amino acid adenylation domain-containing protein [Paenibacillus caseinilyticus]